MPHHKNLTRLVLVGLMFMSSQVAAMDDREILKVPSDIQNRLLTNMRTQFANLDDVLYALGEGDFQAAADIAELRMTMGHSRWQQMIEQGKSMEEIAAERKRFLELDMEERRKLETEGVQHGQGLGRFMPADFRGMGQAFHAAADELARILRETPETPSAENYRQAFAALEEVTAACHACHETYRVPRQGE